MRKLSDLIDMLLSDGPNRAIDNLIDNDNYLKQVNQNIEHIEKSLLDFACNNKEIDTQELKQMIKQYIFQSNNFEVSKNGVIYKQGLKDAIDLFILFKS